MENELSRILSLDLLTYKLPAAENLVLCEWTSEEPVDSSQIFLRTESGDISCIRDIVSK